MPQPELISLEEAKVFPRQKPSNTELCEIIPFRPVWFTVDEYMRREELAEFRNEFRPTGQVVLDGKKVTVGNIVPLMVDFPDENCSLWNLPDGINAEILSMAGGRPEHSLITANMVSEIHRGLKGKKCRVYESNLMIIVPETGLRTYPDLSIICGPLIPPPDSPLAATNPTVVVEVLSPGTTAYDRGRKAENYKQLSTLREYLLVTTTKAKVEHYHRAEEEPWACEVVTGLDAVLRLESIGVSVAMADVYDGVGIEEGEIRERGR